MGGSFSTNALRNPGGMIPKKHRAKRSFFLLRILLKCYCQEKVRSIFIRCFPDCLCSAVNSSRNFAIREESYALLFMPAPMRRTQRSG